MPTLELAAQKTSRASKQAVLDRARDRYDDVAAGLAGDLHRGRITPVEFEERLADEVKRLHVAAYVAGRSGTWGEITPQQWGRLGPIIRFQYSKLRGWRDELQRTPRDADGTLTISEAKLLQRAGYYRSAATQSFERGLVDEIGLASDVLPAYPGDGTTDCMTNCVCRWAIRILNKARGDFNASWRLGNAEHCPTCRKRARSWKRLKVRGGVLQDGYEPISR